MNIKVQNYINAEELDVEANFSIKTTKTNEESNKFISYLKKFIEISPGIDYIDETNGYFKKDQNVNNKILTYDPIQIRTLLAPFISKDLTVCDSVQIWAKHISNVLETIICTIIFSYVFFDDKPGVKASCDALTPKINFNICKAEPILKAATDGFLFLVAFILAGYVVDSVYSWIRKRTAYDSFINMTDTLCFQIITLIPNSKTNTIELNKTRQNLIRWSLLALEISIIKIRCGNEYINENSNEIKNHLIKKKLLIEDYYNEWENMIIEDRCTTIYCWIQEQINQLVTADLCNSDHLGSFSENIKNCRISIADLLSYSGDQPFPYTLLCSLLVKLNVFTMCLWKAVHWSIWLNSIGFDLFLQGRFWLDVGVLFTWNVSYVCMYDLGYLLKNPFGPRRIDVPHEFFFSTVSKINYTLLKVVENTSTEYKFPTSINNFKKD